MTNDCKDPGALAAIGAALDVLAMRGGVPYDGVLGEPPAWIGKTLSQDFRDARTRILDDGHSPDRIQRWMNAYRAPHADTPCPEIYDDGIRTLVLVQDMVRDGEQAALKRFFGEAAFSTIRARAVSDQAREAARKPRKARGVSFQLGALMRVVAAYPDITAQSLRELLAHEPLTYEDEVSDGQHVRRTGNDVVVTNLTTGESFHIAGRHLNAYLRRARQQLAR